MKSYRIIKNTEHNPGGHSEAHNIVIINGIKCYCQKLKKAHGSTLAGIFYLFRQFVIEYIKTINIMINFLTIRKICMKWQDN